MGFNAFRGSGLSDGFIKGMNSGEKLSLGAHNSMLQLANVSGWSTPAMYGAGAGAAYGALDGAFSYDGSILGGAFHGAMLGGVGATGLKFAANTYAKGAVNGFKPFEEAGSKFVSASGGKDGAKFANAWKGNTAGRDGEQLGAFQWGNFGAGW